MDRSEDCKCGFRDDIAKAERVVLCITVAGILSSIAVIVSAVLTFT